METKKCKKCGKTFDCLHSADCWCADLKISKKLSEYLSNTYKDCLCNECLKAYIEKEKNILS